ncbi:MAG: LytTR family DNA-binding domain-containing protein [Bacteroidales bacterium]|jgi:two-component system LytT family response regulator
MIKAIVIDDEKTSRDALSGLLCRYCKNVEIVGQADGYKSGIEEMKKHTEFDVIFLDIQMPDGSGFRLLEETHDINYEVIFTTAFDQYAIKAIKYSALDYLLKPIDPEDLISSLEKFESKKNSISNKPNIKVLLENTKNTDSHFKKIVLSTFEGMHVVDIDNIIHCKAEDCYTNFYFLDGKKMLVSKTLKDFEELLSGYNFIRPHKSHLINLKYVKTYMRTDGGSIVMADETIIPVSRRKREAIIDIINNL